MGARPPTAPVLVCLAAAWACAVAQPFTADQRKPENSGLGAVEIEYFPDTNKFVAKTDDGTFVREYTPFSDKPESETIKEDDDASLDSWSVVWYVASFGGLIVFFLVVSCSEWCCRRNRRRGCAHNTPNSTTVPDTPPPSYDQFAPPPYESLCSGGGASDGEKTQFDVYVVPVHALDTMIAGRPDDAPPSYVTASGGGYSAVYPPTADATPSRAEEGRVGRT